MTTYVHQTYKKIQTTLFVIAKTRKNIYISHQLLQNKLSQKLAADKTNIYISQIV